MKKTSAYQSQQQQYVRDSVLSVIHPKPLDTLICTEAWDIVLESYTDNIEHYEDVKASEFLQL